MLARERVSKGLKGYVASTPVAPAHTDIEAQDDESLVIAQ
jgi:hypothetical protein